MTKQSLIIAIDGPSASGKGTLAKGLAKHFNVPYLNSGALYRAVALKIIKQNIDPNNFINHIDKIIADLDENELENEALFDEEVGQIASITAKEPKLRKALLSWQQDFAKNSQKTHNGCVIDGRDITTVICPDADYKFYIKADVEIRAKRRYDQLQKKGDNVEYDKILQQLKDRDHNDINRKEAPLKIAPDAMIIDNSQLNAKQTVACAIQNISTR